MSIALIISLAPPGMTIKEVLKVIVDDLVGACTDGLKTLDSHGINLRVFDDSISFIYDYPASYSFLDF